MSEPAATEPGMETAWLDEPAPAPNFRARATWPCLGPALWMAGVLLWSYIAFGRLVLNQGFPEVAAFPIVLFCFVLSAYVSLELSFACEPPRTPSARRTRQWQATLLAFGLFLGALSVAVMIGLTSQDDLDAPLSVFLSILAIVAVFVGRRATQAPWLAADPARRALGILLWLASVALTLIAWAN